MTLHTPESAPARRERSLQQTLLNILAVYGLLILLAILIIVFSVLRPNTFPTAFNFRSILSDKSIVAVLALGVMIPLAANQFDLSVGYMVGLSHILVMGFQVRLGMGWLLAVIVVVIIGALVGVVNGLLVTRVKINSFIATLGSGTVLYGIANWYTGGSQVTGTLPREFRNISSAIEGIPVGAIYVLIIGIVLYIVLEYLPLGRQLYVAGANPRAAELLGISQNRLVPAAFAASGALAAFAGVVLGSRLGVGQASVGPDMMLPAFAAALLGATSMKPGRVNVWGTILAVLVLAVAVAGLLQLGAQFFVEPLFNGLMLITSVGLAGYAARRRAALERQASTLAIIQANNAARTAEPAADAPDLPVASGTAAESTASTRQSP